MSDYLIETLEADASEARERADQLERDLATKSATHEVALARVSLLTRANEGLRADKERLEAERDRYREACEYALGGTRQAATMGGAHWERACRLIELEVAEALGMEPILGAKKLPGIDGVIEPPRPAVKQQARGSAQ